MQFLRGDVNHIESSACKWEFILYNIETKISGAGGIAAFLCSFLLDGLTLCGLA
jgi:hypothetical protein